MSTPKALEAPAVDTSAETLELLANSARIIASTDEPLGTWERARLTSIEEALRFLASQPTEPEAMETTAEERAIWLREAVSGDAPGYTFQDHRDAVRLIRDVSRLTEANAIIARQATDLSALRADAIALLRRLSLASKAKDEALRHAADFLKDWDGGNPATEHGWCHVELLDEWRMVRAALSPAPTPAEEGKS